MLSGSLKAILHRALRYGSRRVSGSRVPSLSLRFLFCAVTFLDKMMTLPNGMSDENAASWFAAMPARKFPLSGKRFQAA